MIGEPVRAVRRPSLRERGALLLGRATGAATRRLGRGGGTALPGLVAGAVAPGLIESLAGQLGAGLVTVTGTNGKTTTAHLLSAIAERAELLPLANSSGSNLERGLVSAYVDASGRGGTVAEAARRLGVFEVDEGALPALWPRLRPTVAVFLNLFRDQLDRYGEVDSVAEGWTRMLAIRPFGESPVLVLNADDPSIAQLAEEAPGRVVTFGIADRGVGRTRDHAADARFCRCGGRFAYDAVFMGHVGLWRCDRCDRARPRPDVVAHEVRLGPDETVVHIGIAGHDTELLLPLAGLYSVYNALAAAAAAHALGIRGGLIAESLAAAAPVFGRQERFEIDGREVRMLLAKNPTGLNEVLRVLEISAGGAADGPLTLLAMLNDGIQDGRDVSWIYDADIELLASREIALVCSGDRADDLALRFALAGIEPRAVEPDPERALAVALEATPPGGRLDIVPTYTAMLTMRAMLAERAGVAPYWEASE